MVWVAQGADDRSAPLVIALGEEARSVIVGVVDEARGVRTEELTPARYGEATLGSSAPPGVARWPSSRRLLGGLASVVIPSSYQHAHACRSASATKTAGSSSVSAGCAASPFRVLETPTLPSRLDSTFNPTALYNRTRDDSPHVVALRLWAAPVHRKPRRNHGSRAGRRTRKLPVASAFSDAPAARNSMSRWAPRNDWLAPQTPRRPCRFRCHPWRSPETRCMACAARPTG
jgi:hypothetical protein